MYAAPKLDAFKAHIASVSGVSLDALPIEVSCCAARQGLPRLGCRAAAAAATVGRRIAACAPTCHSRDAQNKHYIAVACALEGLGAAFFILGSDLGAQMLVRPRTALSARRQCLDTAAWRSCCFCSQSRPSCTVSRTTCVSAKALLTTASPVRRLLERARRVRRRALRPGMIVVT